MGAELLSYEEAWRLVVARARALYEQRPIEEVDLMDAAGRILARPLVVDRDMPPFPRSTRDGYACRVVEVSVHKPLPIAGSIRAGQAPAGPLPLGAAWEIMTGAPVPDGADAVVMLEHVDAADGRIRLHDKRVIIPGENIVPQGAEARKGDKFGSRPIRPADIAFAASCGHAKIPVFAKPRVAVLSTGDELVPVDAQPGPGQIRNSNGPMLAALVSAAGGVPSILPTARDTAEALDRALADAADADLLLITGGVSAGKFDLVEEALARAGAQFHFTGVRIQPGKPVVFGELPRSRASENARSQPFFGLPGNPVSAAVTFLLFATETIRMCAGNSGTVESGALFAEARLTENCKGKLGLTQFFPAVCSWMSQPGEYPTVRAIPWQGSGDLAAFAKANCFLVVPEDAERLSAGEVVRVLLLFPEDYSRVQSEPQLSHYDETGKASMVDVSAKQQTRRTATATAFVELSVAVLAALPANPKGNPLEVARFAGIQAAKRTSELIPMCHPLALTHVNVEVEIADGGVRIAATVAAVGPTGVEMEALTAASVAALTVYDMTKALDKGIVIREVRLESKAGGKSGDYARDEQRRGAGESKPE